MERMKQLVITTTITYSANKLSCNSLTKRNNKQKIIAAESER